MKGIQALFYYEGLANDEAKKTYKAWLDHVKKLLG